jgi:Arc/MetJ family transcription regulator
MRTTMSLDDALIKELMEVTGARTRTEAIHLAISELIRRKKLAGLKALSGKIQLADTWQDLEQVELKEQEKQERRRRGHR